MKILSKLMNKPKYVIDVGHEEKQQGAINLSSDLSEFTFNIELATKILDILKTKEFYEEDKQQTYKLLELLDIVVVMRDTYKNLPDKINKQNPKATISLHCNSSEQIATGTEVLVGQGCKESIKLGKILLNNLLDALSLRDRGLKEIEPEDRGGHLVYGTKAPCVISEPFFINNNEDLDTALNSFNDLAEAIVLTFLEYEGYRGVIL